MVVLDVDFFPYLPAAMKIRGLFMVYVACLLSPRILNLGGCFWSSHFQIFWSQDHFTIFKMRTPKSFWFCVIAIDIYHVRN